MIDSPPMRFFRLTVLEADVAALEEALGYALSCWTARLQESDSIEWRNYAVEVHTIRNRLTQAAAQDGERTLLLPGNIAGALGEVAHCCDEADDPATVALAEVARRYAQRVMPTRGSSES